MAEILNITYVPATETLQAVVSFEHKEKTLHTIVKIDLAQTPITTDFKKIIISDEFQAAMAKALSDKIDEFEKPNPSV